MAPPKLILRNFEVPANEQLIGDIIRRYLYFLPAWVNDLTVTIYDNPPDDQFENMIAWSRGLPEYGHASIGMLVGILDRPEAEQRGFILHEILHLIHRREYNFVWDRLLNPIENRNEELYKFLVEDYRERNEEFIEHLTQCIMGREG